MGILLGLEVLHPVHTNAPQFLHCNTDFLNYALILNYFTKKLKFLLALLIFSLEIPR